MSRTVTETKYLLKAIYKWFKSPVFRVHLLKIIAVLLFLTLIGAAYGVHIIYSNEYIAFREITTSTHLRRDVSRGQIVDRNGTVLVTNESVPIITFRHVPNTSVVSIRNVAIRLAELIELDFTLSARDKRDLFILLHFDVARDLVPSDERESDNALFNAQMIAAIEDEHLLLLTDTQKRAHAIFLRMNQGTGRVTNIIKENPSDIEIARIIENLSDLPGIDIGMDWRRIYPSDMARDFFGHVSSHQQGIPRDREAYFLQRGYAPNARVGTSQLERVLQTELAGFQYRYFLDDGEEIQLSEGMNGFDISLNLDNELQLRLEDIVSSLLLNEVTNHRRTRGPSRYARSAYAVVTNPFTGAIYAMVGVNLIEEDGELQAVMNPLGTFQNAYLVGSSIKGATLMAGYFYGYTTVGESRLDAPINIQGSSPFLSWRNMGWVNDIHALRESSNVFFYRQTMAMTGNANHQQNQGIRAWNPEAWDMYLDFFANVGLGSRTGIELPNESTGFNSITREFHELMNFGIGQTSSYTTMQLAQFGGVLATQGMRMQLQLIENIYLPVLGEQEPRLIRPFTPNLMNRINLTDAQWNQISEGHRQVVTHPNGTGHGIFNPMSIPVSGKTGTAEMNMTEIVINDEGMPVLRHMRSANGQPVQGLNRTFVGYAPRDNPEIVISVIVPQSALPGLNNGSSLVNIIARDVVEAYFDLQLERNLIEGKYDDVEN